MKFLQRLSSPYGLIAMGLVIIALSLFVLDASHRLNKMHENEPDDPRPFLNAEFCQGICTIKNSPGGYVEQFKEAAVTMVTQRQLLVIDGTCASACTILVDDVYQAGGLLCITDKANFWYHMSIRENAYGWSDTNRYVYSEPTEDLLEAAGGLPEQGMVMILAPQLQDIYPRCPDNIQALV